MSDWTIETKEEASRRNANIDGRYQVVDGRLGELIDTTSRFADAVAIGDRYETRRAPNGSLFCGQPGHVEIFDRMARNGSAQTWRRIQRPATFCMEHRDTTSRIVVDDKVVEAVWKVIGRRGVSAPDLSDLTTRLWS